MLLTEKEKANINRLCNKLARLLGKKAASTTLTSEGTHEINTCRNSLKRYVAIGDLTDEQKEKINALLRLR